MIFQFQDFAAAVVQQQEREAGELLGCAGVGAIVDHDFVERVRSAQIELPPRVVGLFGVRLAFVGELAGAIAVDGSCRDGTVGRIFCSAKP